MGGGSNRKMSATRDDDSGEEEYELEEIRGKVVVDGMKQYHVKWKGYASDENTWEPETNIDPSVVRLYERQEMNEVRKSEGPEAEKIIEYRHDTNKGEDLVLVKWIGWPDKHNSWEPVSSYRDTQLLRDFDQQQAAKRKKMQKLKAAEKEAVAAKKTIKSKPTQPKAKAAPKAKAKPAAKKVPEKKGRTLPKKGAVSKRVKTIPESEEEEEEEGFDVVAVEEDDETESDSSEGSHISWAAGGEYEVEKVLKHRGQGESQEFFIKWKGWPDSFNQWASKEDCEGCPQLVQNYWNRIKRKSAQKRAPKHVVYPPKVVKSRAERAAERASREEEAEAPEEERSLKRPRKLTKEVPEKVDGLNENEEEEQRSKQSRTTKKVPAKAEVSDEEEEDDEAKETAIPNSSRNMKKKVEESDEEEQQEERSFKRSTRVPKSGEMKKVQEADDEDMAVPVVKRRKRVGLPRKETVSKTQPEKKQNENEDEDEAPTKKKQKMKKKADDEKAKTNEKENDESLSLRKTSDEHQSPVATPLKDKAPAVAFDSNSLLDRIRSRIGSIQSLGRRVSRSPSKTL